MEASTGPPRLPSPSLSPSINIENLKQKLLQNDVVPTPKIIHTLRKKELQKFNRRLAKQASKEPTPLTETQKQALTEESYFQVVKSEYKSFKKEVNAKNDEKIVGKPWERIEKLKLQELSSENKVYSGDKLNSEHLWELSDIIESERDKFSWLLDNDVEIKQGWFNNERANWDYRQRRRGEAEIIRFIIDRLSGMELGVKDYKFSKLMKHSGLQYTEKQMLSLMEGLAERGQWRHALSVVHWVYNSKEHKRSKSRATVLSVFNLSYIFVDGFVSELQFFLGKARRPREALQVFNLMRGDTHIYPDIAAYHSVAVTLDQAGLLKELISIIDCMKQTRKNKYMRRKNWDLVLQPDLVVYNALRKNGPSYGLAMEVMLQSGKYDLVHEFFGKMKRSGEALKALSYKILVKSLWEEGRVNEAIQAVREMEQRGVVGSASVYYELACCLCYHGMWKEAFLEIEKLKMLRHTRPLAVTFTGMILSSMDGGHIDGIPVFNLARVILVLPVVQMHIHTPRCLSPLLALSSGNTEYVYKEMALAGYQVDQSRHAYLLMEASKAGKVHLLEHTFDAILEVGQIPHQSFFFEILCQATCQHDHERAVALIKSMVHAPFQVSKQQVLSIDEPVKFATDASTYTDEFNLQHVQVDQGDCSDEVYDEREKGGDRERVSDLSHFSHRKDEWTGTNITSELSDEGLTFKDQFDCLDDIDDQLGLGLSSDEDDNSCETKVPSADEILKTWEDMRKKDATFFNFQLGQM
ncbi:hypothetical protein RND71_033011 [Anisodus tanguticus]|uniref:Pentatricopeptide repeat-containing protein n=1 Tax=Anisodus tanguticus TaxID=243964 RepID=A0AAE1UX42_9SOLA|nr:hypothetical protein RND71_033011 [Anisodus tanguticus]